MFAVATAHPFVQRADRCTAARIARHATQMRIDLRRHSAVQCVNSRFVRRSVVKRAPDQFLNRLLEGLAIHFLAVLALNLVILLQQRKRILQLTADARK